MARTGRPRKEINQKQFEYLCGIFCTEEEIAGLFDCSIDTLERWCKRTYKETFADVYKKKISNGKMSLRRTQFEMAKTNPTMAIFLGKQYLGQSDRLIQETTSISPERRKEIDDFFDSVSFDPVIEDDEA